MPKLILTPSSVRGTLSLPPSKSHSIRSLLFAHKASGPSMVHGLLSSPDTEGMLRAIQALGSQVERRGESLLIQKGKEKFESQEIDCGNSGQVLRFLGALAALSPQETRFFGDASLSNLRPVQPLLDGLFQLGARAKCLGKPGHAPISVQGPLTKNFARISGIDSQPVSGLLFAAAFAPHPITLVVDDPGETAWIELSLSWLDRFQLPYEKVGFNEYRLQGEGVISPFEYTVPADWSSAAFPIGAALVTQSTLRIGPLDFQDPQGDKAIVSLLQTMGANLIQEGSFLLIQPSSLQGRAIDVNPFIDALPILSVLGCFAQGETLLYNGAIARNKESDRIACMAYELKKMGAKIEERPDGLLIFPSKLRGTTLDSHQDHRVALSLAVAALGAFGQSTIEGFEVTKKSYPRFAESLRQLGAKVEEE